MKKTMTAAIMAACAVMAASAGAQAQTGDNFIGEIKWVGFDFAPRGWAKCDGQLLPIASHTALFSLIGTQYGGDGRTTFALPDARGRNLMHAGNGPGLTPRQMGQRFGAETSTLNTVNLPNHSHAATATAQLNASSTGGNSNMPAGRVLADDGTDRIYSDQAPDVAMRSDAVTVDVQVQPNGGGQPVDNMSPQVVANCIIALQGIFPSRN